MMIALVAVAASAKDIKTLVVTTQPVMHCNSCEEKIKNNRLLRPTSPIRLLRLPMMPTRTTPKRL